jgi:hypothetical protein
MMFRAIIGTTRKRAGFASAALALLSAGDAFASQGPGIAPGTVGAATQLGMAIAVYGAAALVVAAGLIGALRRRGTQPRRQ